MGLFIVLGFITQVYGTFKIGLYSHRWLSKFWKRLLKGRVVARLEDAPTLACTRFQVLGSDLLLRPSKPSIPSG